MFKVITRFFETPQFSQTPHFLEISSKSFASETCFFNSRQGKPHKKGKQLFHLI